MQSNSQENISPYTLCARLNAPNLASYQPIPNTAPVSYTLPSLGPSIVNNDDEDSDISVCFFDSPCKAVLYFSGTTYPFRFCDEPTH